MRGEYRLPVHHVKTMKMFESAKKFRGIKPTAFFAEASFALELEEELSSFDVRQYEVQFLRALKAELERHNERAVHLS